MSYDGEKLFNLLPAIYRLRDAEQGGALRQLMAVIAEQMALLEARTSSFTTTNSSKPAPSGWCPISAI